MRVSVSASVLLVAIALTVTTDAARAQSTQKQDSSTVRAPQTVAQDTASQSASPDTAVVKEAATAEKPGFDLDQRMLWIIALGSLIVAAFMAWLAFWQYRKRIADKGDIRHVELKVEDKHKEAKEAAQAQTDEQRYRAALEKELGTIKILGSPEIDSIPVNLLDAFVSLDLSETWRGEHRFDTGKQEKMPAELRHLKPEEVLQRAFSRFNLLLLIGDPGSGKTTLMKFYALNCLTNDGHKRLGFTRPVLPLYFPLRDLEPKDRTPAPLPQNLARWAEQHVLDIASGTFRDWLHNSDTLVLLDGLDEISDIGQRKRVCAWIDATANGLTRACFVVTSRWTGYRKADGIELACDHLRADVRDFNPEQQEEFLSKWFRAVYKLEYKGEGMPSAAWLQQQEKLADLHAARVVGFLRDQANRSLRQLATVPMLLQIMAILWKERDVLPESRSALYDASLNYLLDYRDKRRNLNPVLRAREARRVLSPVALWMQETLQRDEAQKSEMHDRMQPILNTMQTQPAAEKFCDNLIERAGLLAEYGEEEYIFRHKSFREYLAGVQLAHEKKPDKKIQLLIKHFGEDWWEEPLRFFMSEADADTFDRCMQLFFGSKISEKLSDKQQTLLQTVIREAPQRKVDSLAAHLLAPRANKERQRYILESLRTIGTVDALVKVSEFIDASRSADSANLSFAEEIVAKLNARRHKDAEVSAEDIAVTAAGWIAASVRNPLEENAEYILIPGGEFEYSVSKKIEPVAPLYFAKYPVTNRLYRRFISYLDGNGEPATRHLPADLFAERLLAFAKDIPDYTDYLGTDRKGWPAKLRSEEDENKRFNPDEHPVVGVSWFAARAYCFWLSCLDRVSEDAKLEDADVLSHLYRLPAEPEWEWAAAGREKDGWLRMYPWPKDRGEPTDKLANFDGNVGATTPVGRYPEGATPEGLMDMAGNVYEWMENWYDDNKDVRALRGGSWYDAAVDLRCSLRDSLDPDIRLNFIGFRVLRQPGSEW